MQIEGIDTGRLYGHLWDKYQIMTSPIVHHEQFEGMRVTPNVYTTLEEIDVFAEAMLDVLKNGFPVEKKAGADEGRDVRQKDGTRKGRELTKEQKQKDLQDARDKEAKELREAEEAKAAREAREKEVKGGAGLSRANVIVVSMASPTRRERHRLPLLPGRRSPEGAESRGLGCPDWRLAR